MIKSKGFFSLLEILVGMTLAMTVLITGLYFYRYATVMDSKLKKEEAEVTKARILSARLSTIFSHMEKTPFFTAPEAQEITLGPSLIFAFEEQSRDPRFYGKVLARLFVDPHKRLLLTLWPLKDSDHPMHYEVLAERVEEISFSFLMGPESQKPGAFVAEWSAEEESLPAAIRIKLHGEVETDLAFPLVGSTQAPDVEGS